MCKVSGVILTACLFAGAPAWAATEPKIGTAAVTNKEVSGSLGSERRVLKRGDGIFQNETIATGRDAGAQLLFTDETALTMGPDSRVILDKLIYDPSKRSGQMTIRAVTGAFRFVTGSGPKESYKIETPVGTIGVRGTIIQFAIQGLQLSLQLDEGGAYFCSAQRRCVELTKPGTYVVVTGQQVGSSQSKYIKGCDASGGSANCSVTDGDQTLYIQFLGLRKPLTDLAPAAGPSAPPPPAPPPPASTPPPPKPLPVTEPAPPPPTKTLPVTLPPPPPPVKTLPLPPPPTGSTTIFKK